MLSIKPPFTSETLLAHASAKEQEHEALAKQFPSGTYNKERNDARAESERALICAAWMDSKGIKEAADIGPYQSTTVKKGMKIQVKKGALVFSTKPGWPHSGKHSVRVQTVEVHNVNRGYIDFNNGNRGAEQVIQPVVNWAGAGGYWCRTNIENIEVDEVESEQSRDQAIATA